MNQTKRPFLKAAGAVAALAATGLLPAAQAAATPIAPSAMIVPSHLAAWPTPSAVPWLRPCRVPWVSPWWSRTRPVQEVASACGPCPWPNPTATRS